jgi:hypothetical protein
MSGEIFSEVAFARGAGFGNRLFPWARCRLFSRRYGVRMLAPAWTQWRVGPLLRGGVDLLSYPRQILLMGLFNGDNYVAGTTRAWVAATAARVAEPPHWNDWRESSVSRNTVSRNTIVCFAGYGNMFGDFLEHRKTLLHELRLDTRPRWLKVADSMAAPIAVNVRCGRDFREAASPQDYYKSGALRTPIPWFVRALEFVRRAAGAQVPAVVVSDGAADELSELLSLPDVTFARPGCAISDLLVLSRGRVLIGSGGSSFSAWAAFLSGAPSLTHPGQSLQWFRLGTPGGPFVGELDPAHPPEGLEEEIDRALHRHTEAV